MTAADHVDLRTRLADRVAKVDAQVAYSIVPFDGTDAIRVAGEARMATASTYKVYLLAALYAADAAGRLSLDTRVESTPELHTRGSGVLKLLAPGLTPTLRDLARLMIVVSDNVATNLVTRRTSTLETIIPSTT
ncbi:MAG TPA: serine hydrolase [Candidatus Kryptonia bacterium]|nr:serine hydrolase [Candidatus Kryptonia bacterium]